MKYLDFEKVPEGMESRVKQSLKFRTGKFVWRISFNVPLDPATTTNKNIYVTNLQNRIIDCNIYYKAAENIIQIEPLGAYKEDESYILHITKNVKSRAGKSLKKPINIQFKL